MPSATFSDPGALSPPSGLITSISAFFWNDSVVVAFRTTERKVFVNRSIGGDAAGRMFWASITPVQITSDTDFDSEDIELAPMYVRTDRGVPAYPASHASDVYSELLGVFYTSGIGSSAVHKWRNAAPGSPLLPWSIARDVIKFGDVGALSGDVSPGVAVWPARSANPFANNYRDLGQACGIFPRRLVTGPPATRDAQFYCYNKNADRWEQMASGTNGFAVTAALGRKPGLAFHTFRDSAGSPIDERRGQFWGGEVLDSGALVLSVSEAVGPATPPSSGLRFHRPEGTNPTLQRMGISIYADRDLSAVKALGLYAIDGVNYFQLHGMWDGSVHAELRDGNDFNVMELGICRGLHRTTAYCCKWGYSECLGHYDLPL